MYEKILATICTAVITLGTIWFVCRRDSDRRASNGTKSDARSVKDSIDRAGDNNQRIADAERTTAERLGEQAATIERAGQGNQRAQDLVQKAKDILHDAQHTN